MGQQQLILLVLATIIVGLAVIVGIRAFGETSVRSNADALMFDSIRIANDLQAWRIKPPQFGGSRRPHTAKAEKFHGASLAMLGYGVVDDQYTNQNGVYTLKVLGNRALIVAASEVFDNRVEVIVCGLTDSDVVGEIVALEGRTLGSTPTCPGSS